MAPIVVAQWHKPNTADRGALCRLVANASATVSEMRDGFNEVEDMAARIGEIAGKANVLAQNSSIEAGQTGEEGNGFVFIRAHGGIFN